MAKGKPVKLTKKPSPKGGKTAARPMPVPAHMMGGGKLGKGCGK